ncbi:hypothetical protein BT96DRAFT_948611 [Gymnopus androsaceus JB14]|uniref:Uncharacterized protein n=1 Tax=Gymnopus androsaceus JB14 TaxID=1447944 RepID=A0A6A4GPG2_9AGAR|nr:hypothetical protein BT96DRAFT_948611 [Gymnopus androsaceus JB14]
MKYLVFTANVSTSIQIYQELLLDYYSILVREQQYFLKVPVTSAGNGYFKRRVSTGTDQINTPDLETAYVTGTQANAGVTTGHCFNRMEHCRLFGCLGIAGEKDLSTSDIIQGRGFDLAVTVLYLAPLNFT